MIQNLKQTINLYSTSHEYVPLLGATKIISIWAYMLVFFILVFIYQQWKVGELQTEVDKFKTKQQWVDSQLKQIDFSVKNKGIMAKNSQMELLKEKIKNSQSLIDQILEQEQAQEKNKPILVSAILEGLALGHIKGTYIAVIHLQNGGKKVSFEGFALLPTLVPMLIQSWQTIPSLNRMEFKKLEIQELNPSSPIVQFSLQGE
jgi:hypothetical protein